MSFTHFIPNPMLGAELSRSRMLQPALLNIAENIRDEAKQLSPEDKGDYINSIEAKSGVDGRGVYAAVEATDWKAALIEFGTADTPAFAPIRKAADKYGALRAY